jgi:hypothetical protein
MACTVLSFGYKILRVPEVYAFCLADHEHFILQRSEEGVFSECSSLETISIPAQIELLGKWHLAEVSLLPFARHCRV